MTDYRDAYFKDTRQEVFRGTGQVLGGETRPSRLVPESKTAEKNHDAVPMNTPEHTQFKVATERPGKENQLFNNLSYVYTPPTPLFGKEGSFWFRPVSLLVHQSVGQQTEFVHSISQDPFT